MNSEIIQIMPAENLPFLTSVYLWGLNLIEAIQTAANPFLTVFLKIITTIGSEAFVIPFLLLVYWCIDEKRGFRLGMLIIFSAWTNTIFKHLFKQPRPYNLDPSVGMALESSYGFPSGHAQNSLCLWVPIMSWAGSRKKESRLAIWISAIILMLLIAFSRLYLGVHFPTDILGGWIIGGIILTAFYMASPWLGAWFIMRGKRTQMICTAAIALIMNGLYPMDTSLPALFLGFGAGYSLMINSFPFTAQGLVKGKKPGIFLLTARYILGLSGAAVIYLGLRLILPGENSLFASISFWGLGSPYTELGRFIRYCLLGLWASAGAPKVFLNLGIAGPGKES
ncbi:phosphatase PAP2 family protein [Leadbettera azotonutricia]|uniref:Putative membrane-associated phospholipid phosphatase n=1 Tax=Leadbettera azotonutricia (strain ATCC BAA-888 / DSM 13862 / ZAS-9) TaxID=545695 RepID=F5YFB1_LEAAZ|nr:phosphatase PAP2 family protein [Leadbettera azotonutricia]AEF80594.1 putative membrane-associated phospholipid phosphatase [Leadbettera azotonutricia ZAS-9]